MALRNPVHPISLLTVLTLKDTSKIEIKISPIYASFYKCEPNIQFKFKILKKNYTYTHANMHTYIYIYMCLKSFLLLSINRLDVESFLYNLRISYENLKYSK